MHGVNRALKERIRGALEFFPAVALLGPRQCGKTTLAQEIQESWEGKSVYLDLENVTDLAKLEDAVGFLGPLENDSLLSDFMSWRRRITTDFGLGEDSRIAS